MVGTINNEMSNDAAPASHGESLELSVAELMRRARPLPPLEGMRIDDLNRRRGRSLPRCSAFVNAPRFRGPVVVDTDVYGAQLTRSSLPSDTSR